MVKVFTEKSRSRSGKHQRIASYVVVNESCGSVKYKVVSREPGKTLYVVGERVDEVIEAPDGSYVVQLDFRKGLTGRVKGEIKVYDPLGNLLGRAVYRKMKVRLVEYVSPAVLDIIKCVLRRLKIPVKRYGVLRRGREV